MKKVLVLGSKGMLGRYVYKYLKKNKDLDVIEISRYQLDPTIHSKITEISQLLSHLKLRAGDYVINCIGDIQNRTNHHDTLNALQINAVFPHLLERGCALCGATLIHPTTDCVFSGSKGNYIESDTHDVSDLYGRTKSLGEPKNSISIRTSIIGEEVKNKRSLIEWVKSQEGKEVNGYTNHKWNGITCLEFAHLSEKIVEDNMFWKGPRHYFSPEPIIKGELIKLISSIYDLNIKVKMGAFGEMCDRTLASEMIEYGKITKSLEDQIIEQLQFKL